MAVDNVLKGQWIGNIFGSNKAIATLNIDEDSPNKGRLLIVDEDINNPNFYSDVNIENIGVNNYKAKVDFFKYPGSPEGNAPKAGELKIIMHENRLSGDWDTDIGTRGSFIFNSYISDAPKPPTHEFTWDDYKKWISDRLVTSNKCIYRGHRKNIYKLRTSLHREGRYDLLRYQYENIPELVRNIGVITGKFYNLHNDYEYGSILNIAQHHGYATPLLDWTESPFIAAYFAFWSSEPNENSKEEKVRIYEFDYEGWSKNNPVGRPLLDTPDPYISALKLPSLDNPRAIPQQSVVLFSNVVEVEDHIALHESIQKAEYIKRIDISTSEMDRALCEMRLMGITRASLFPGLDGVCEELRSKHFRRSHM